MTTATEVKIPLTAENIMQKCMCGQCPIQAKSQCVKEVGKNLEEAVKKSPIPREEVPGMYCSTGKAFCPDLDFKNPCMCGTCTIFNEDYHLADTNPSGFFCKGGKAIHCA